MKNIPEHQKGILAVVITAILWSSGGLFIKLITLSAMEISFFRCLIAAITFALFFGKNIIKANRLALINAFFYACVLILFVLATKMTTAANAIFLQSTAPIYVLIFEPLINKTQYKKINVITVIVCVIGMLLFFVGEISPSHMEGNIVALLAGVSFAAFFIGMRKNKGSYQLSSIFYGNIIVAVICIPFIIELTSVSFPDLWRVSFLGVFQIALAYAIFTYGISRILAIEASLLSMIEPVLNPVWVYIGYGEIPSVTAIIGGIIIIGAITVRTILTGTPAMKGKIKKFSGG